MKLKDLLSNPKIRALPPNEFKTYCLLYEKANLGVIRPFTIRGFLRELQENENHLNMPTGKNTVKDIIRSLNDKKCIELDIKNETLTLLVVKT